MHFQTDLSQDSMELDKVILLLLTICQFRQNLELEQKQTLLACISNKLETKYWTKFYQIKKSNMLFLKVRVRISEWLIHRVIRKAINIFNFNQELFRMEHRIKDL